MLKSGQIIARRCDRLQALYEQADNGSEIDWARVDLMGAIEGIQLAQAFTTEGGERVRQYDDAFERRAREA